MALLVFNGCDPAARRNVDEERDPHFLEGQNALARLDWEEAIRRFESALESNPNSGVAHRELGLLFDDKKTNYLRALYHYDRYRDLRPAAKDPVVDDHVYSCQVNLAQKLAVYLDRNQARSEAEVLRTNLALKELELTQRRQSESNLIRATNLLGSQLFEMSRRLEAAAKSPAPVGIVDLSAVQGVRRASGPAVTGQKTGDSMVSGSTLSTQLPPAVLRSATTTKPAPVPPVKVPSGPRIHSVRNGDTLAKIARQYGVTMTRLQAANPGIALRILKTGMTLQIPAN